MISPQVILDFWFVESGPREWFQGSESFDQKIQNRFTEVHRLARHGDLSSWRETDEGRLAEILILDQFSRNMFRGKPESFAQDKLALHLAEEAVQHEADQRTPLERRSFFYMPYMHSESKDVHEHALKLFAQKGLEEGLKFEHLHKKIIDRFGRYPHRNSVLGRTSTLEEIAFLKEPHSSF